MPKAHFELARAVLTTKPGRYLLLAALTVDVFVFPSLVAVGALRPWATALSFAATLIAALLAVGEHRAARGLILAVVALAVAARLATLFLGATAFLVAQVATAGIASVAFGALLLADVFSKGKVGDRMVAALLAYLLIGLAFANAFAILDLAHPGAISLPGPGLTMAEFIYFSFSTLTSVGYGDLVPVHPFARSLAMIEALSGQLYLVLVVARFVGDRPIASPTHGEG